MYGRALEGADGGVGGRRGGVCDVEQEERRRSGENEGERKGGTTVKNPIARSHTYLSSSVS